MASTCGTAIPSLHGLASMSFPTTTQSASEPWSLLTPHPFSSPFGKPSSRCCLKRHSKRQVAQGWVRVRDQVVLQVTFNKGWLVFVLATLDRDFQHTQIIEACAMHSLHHVVYHAESCSHGAAGDVIIWNVHFSINMACDPLIMMYSIIVSLCHACRLSLWTAARTTMPCLWSGLVLSWPSTSCNLLSRMHSESATAQHPPWLCTLNP